MDILTIMKMDIIWMNLEFQIMQDMTEILHHQIKHFHQMKIQIY